MNAKWLMSPIVFVLAALLFAPSFAAASDDGAVLDAARAVIEAAQALEDAIVNAAAHAGEQDPQADGEGTVNMDGGAMPESDAEADGYDEPPDGAAADPDARGPPELDGSND